MRSHEEECRRQLDGSDGWQRLVSCLMSCLMSDVSCLLWARLSGIRGGDGEFGELCICRRWRRRRIRRWSNAVE
jgi:hypothetical protein